VTVGLPWPGAPRGGEIRAACDRSTGVHKRSSLHHCWDWRTTICIGSAAGGSGWATRKACHGHGKPPAA